MVKTFELSQLPLCRMSDILATWGTWPSDVVVYVIDAMPTKGALKRESIWRAIICSNEANRRCSVVLYGLKQLFQVVQEDGLKCTGGKSQMEKKWAFLQTLNVIQH